MSTLLEPFHYEFFQRALLVATITGALCGRSACTSCSAA